VAGASGRCCSGRLSLGRNVAASSRCCSGRLRLAAIFAALIQRRLTDARLPRAQALRSRSRRRRAGERRPGSRPVSRGRDFPQPGRVQAVRGARAGVEGSPGGRAGTRRWRQLPLPAPTRGRSARSPPAPAISSSVEALANSWSITSSGIRPSPSHLARPTASSTVRVPSFKPRRTVGGVAGGSPSGSPPAPPESRPVADSRNFFCWVEGMSVAFVHAYTISRTLPSRTGEAMLAARWASCPSRVSTTATPRASAGGGCSWRAGPGLR